MGPDDIGIISPLTACFASEDLPSLSAMERQAACATEGGETPPGKFTSETLMLHWEARRLRGKFTSETLMLHWVR